MPPQRSPGPVAVFACALVGLSAIARAQTAGKVELELDPLESAERPHVRSQLVPVRAGELLYVASGLRLFALDAFTLEPRWRAGPPSGWYSLDPARRAELLEGVDHEFAWSAPNVGARAVVAALQLPLARGRREEHMGVVIARALPERRLFAFDRFTGRRLWDHVPPELAPGSDPRVELDRRGVALARRASVIGPPLVVGERVLVPCSSDSSSVDYRVAAYELADGGAVWATFVLRGQVARDGLGFVLDEFLAPPLVLTPDGRHVLVLTGLGTLALLDASTGEIGWSTRYPAEPLPRSHAHMPPRRSLRWRGTPPLVVGETVIAAPPDARALFAFDLVDGRLLWSLSEADELALFPCRPETDHLAGVAGDTLWLGGPELAAVRCIGGLRAPASFELAWTDPLGCASGARARLVGQTLFVPDATRVRALDACTGVTRRAYEADATVGLLVDDAELVAVGAGTLARIER